VIADGTLYIGSEDEHIYAIDAAEGEKQWQFETEKRARKSPTVSGETVYAGASGSSGSGIVYALDTDDGTEQWRYQTSGNISGSPTVVNDTVYVTGTPERNGTVHAIDATDGTELWSTEIGGYLLSGPTVAAGTVYVGNNNGTLYALDAANGAEQWTFETNDAVGTPTVADGTVYVPSKSIYAVDTNTQTEQWNADLGGTSVVAGHEIPGKPLVAGGRVYASGSSILKAYATSDGTEQWTTGASKAENRVGGVRSGVAHDSEVLSVVGVNNIYAVAESSGSRLDAFRIAEDASSDQVYSPVMDGEMSYVGSADGNLYALSR
jgi:outer membrane protein assembly factor BamB